MSIKTNSPADTSTSNANWGTLVIVLLVIVIGGVVGALTFGRHAETGPILINPPQQAAPLPAAPAPATAPTASSPVNSSP